MNIRVGLPHGYFLVFLTNNAIIADMSYDSQNAYYE